MVRSIQEIDADAELSGSARRTVPVRLEARVILWLLALLSGGAVITLATVTHLQSQTLQEQSRETGRLLGESTKSSLEVGMLHNARNELEETLVSLEKGGPVSQVAVFRPDRSAWVAAGPVSLSDSQRRALSESLARGRTRSSSDGQALSVYVPVFKDPACSSCHEGDPPVLGAVGVSMDEGALHRHLIDSNRTGLMIGSVPLLIGLIVSLLAVRLQLLRPLGMLGAAAERVGQGDLSARLPRLPGREFEFVGRAFNRMSSRLERQSEDLGRTVAGLRADLEGMEELQLLIASGGGLDEVLVRAAAGIGSVLAASGVTVWRPGTASPEARWGRSLPRRAAELGSAPFDGNGSCGGMTSAGPLPRVSDDDDVSWLVLPAERHGRCLARVGIGWDRSRSLVSGERELARSLTGLVAVAIENAELLERLHEKEQTLQALLRATFDAREEERKRIARELHDETSQVVHALFMNAELLETQVPDSEPLKARLDAMRVLAEEAGRNLDKIMLDLRPQLLEELGLAAALPFYASQVRQAWGVPVEVRVEGVRRLPEHLETAAFRIAQEGISNAVRHSGAQHVELEVSVDDGVLVIEVRDDGIGFDPAEAADRARHGQAAGLMGASERAELLDGTFQVSSRPGAGTTVRAELPLPTTTGEAR